MKKSNVVSFICGAVIFSSVTVFAQEALRIENNRYPIYVDGKEQAVEGYNINDYTYLKLSDFKKIMPVDIQFDDKTESIQIKNQGNSQAVNQAELKTRTDDGVKIEYINGKGYVNVFDLQYKYNCLAVGSPIEKKLRIYGEKIYPAWDTDYMKPLIETDNFIENSAWYFDVDYYENTIKSILSQPRPKQSTYTENNLGIYVENEVEYVLPSDIIREYFGDQYGFSYAGNNKFNILKLDKPGDYSKGTILISGIPSKPINGHLRIEYSYFKEKILPLFKK